MRLIDADAIEIPMMQTESDEQWMKIAINAAPTIEAEPVRHVQMQYNGLCHYCPDCNTMVFDPNADQFCRRCGAKMDGGADNEAGGNQRESEPPRPV